MPGPLSGAFHRRLPYRASWLAECLPGQYPHGRHRAPAGLLAAQGRAGAWGERFDIAGSAIYSLALVAFIFGLSRVPDTWSWAVVATGVLAGVVFVLWELRMEHPMMNVSLCRHNTVFA